jgi:MFS family permease
MLVGGVLPVFLTGSIYGILACRLLLGIGTGCFGIRNALVIKSYTEEKRANMLGMGGFVQSLSGIILSSLAGVLADVSWNLGFAGYAVCIVTVLMSGIFLKEPEAQVAAPVTEEGPVKTEKARYPAVIFIMGVFLALTSISGYCIIIGISTFLKEQNLGTSSMAGTVISVFSIGGVVFSYLFGKIFAALKKYNLPVFALILIAGLALINLGGNVIFIYIGAFLSGGAFACYMAATLAFAGQIADPKLVTSSTTIIMTINQVGIILSGYFVTLAGKVFTSLSEVSASYLLGIIIMAIIAVICILFRIYPKSYRINA